MKSRSRSTLLVSCGVVIAFMGALVVGRADVAETSRGSPAAIADEGARGSRIAADATLAPGAISDLAEAMIVADLTPLDQEVMAQAKAAAK